MANGCLILGVDGGGSKTAARIARLQSSASPEDPDARNCRIETLGQGYGGPSNFRAVGPEQARINLDAAIDAAHQHAGTTGESIEAAVLALAGSSLSDVHSFVLQWADKRNLARDVSVVHDAEPVLAAGCPSRQGVALIVGTGSVAIGVDGAGARVVVGGWGHWFGDQGSGYDLGRQALVAVASAEDGIGSPTMLTERVLAFLRTNREREILQKLNQSSDVRREIASLAPLLLRAALDGDAVALQIVKDAAISAASLVHATVSKSGFCDPVPLAMAGGIVCSSSLYRDCLERSLKDRAVELASVALVDQPVVGSLILARDRVAVAGHG